MIPRTNSSRWLTGAAVVVALLIAFSVVMAVSNRDREPDLLPDGTPGRAVQEYLLAVQRQDTSAAYALLSEETREQCNRESSEGEGFFYAPLHYAPRGSFSIRLVREEADGGNAAVTVETTEVNAPRDLPLLGGSVSEYETTYTLTREDGAWRLRNPGRLVWPCLPESTPKPPEEPSPEEQ